MNKNNEIRISVTKIKGQGCHKIRCSQEYILKFSLGVLNQHQNLEIK